MRFMKRKKNRLWAVTFGVIALFFTLPLKAQVNVGKDSVPHSFSILELSTDIEKGGLRLPQFTTTGRETDLTPQLTATPAEGLTIFNAETNCFEFWNGSRWVSLCDNVAFNPSMYKPGSGCLTGIACFDVLKTEGSPSVPGRGYLSWRRKTSFNTYQDFTQPVTYTYTPVTPVSNVRFAYVDETGAIVESLTQDNPDDATGTNITSASATLHFKSSATTSATGLTQANALKVDIYAIYNDAADGSGKDKMVKLTAIIKDGGCCGAYSITSAAGCKVWTNFMCHNLGANETLDPFTFVAGATPLSANPSSGDGSDGTLGWVFQWGRPADGHQLLNSDTTSVLATSPSNAGSAFIVRVANPPYNWLSTPNDKLWNSGTEAVPVKTIYDPCPDGWRVPTRTEYAKLFNGTTAGGDPSTATANTWVSSGDWTGTPGSAGYMVGNALYFPAAGYRAGGGNMVYVGASAKNDGGHYWSSTPNGTGAYLLNFYSNSVTNFGSAFRYYGRSVRCIAQ